MKKRVKTMEFPSIRVYEFVVRRILLNNIAYIIAFSLLASTARADDAKKPTFIVFDENGYTSEVVSKLEESGARIRQQVPPSILILDLPPQTLIQDVKGIRSVTTQAISVENLRPWGPLAMAAGLQWNRRFVNDAQTQGVNSFSAMRVQVAKKSLPRPQHVTLEKNQFSLSCEWDPIDGALLYEIEARIDFSKDKKILTKTNHAFVELPLIEDGAPHTITVRVRGIDHLEGEHKEEDDMFGAWSDPAPLNIPATRENSEVSPPQLTSPVDKFKSEGFTMILEWVSSAPGAHRVQISRSPSFTETLLDEVVDQNEFVCPSQIFHIGDELYWRVKNTGEASSPWSSSRRFEIGAPAPTLADTFVNPELPQ